MMALVPKLLLAVACGISAVSAQSVSSFDNYQGAIDCVNQRAKVGSTAGFASVLGIGFGGQRGPDHYWSFTLSQETDVTFNSCATDSDFTPIITVYHSLLFDRLLPPRLPGGLPTVRLRGFVQAHGTASRMCPGADSDTTARQAAVWTNRLPAGAYWVNLELGINTHDAGEYSMTTNCVAAPTAPPTPSPTTAPPTTAPPTTQPTGGPTFEDNGVNTSPPTPPPINGPPYVLGLGGGYCPPGYGEYAWLDDPNRRPLRFNEPRGRIVLTLSHVECAARCTNYSAPRYMGGCKGYMTGMYAGMLFCRNYGGGSSNYGPAKNPKFTKPCAYWANPVNPGMFSGQLGSVSSTGLTNVGGQCCSSTDWLIRETRPATTQVGYDHVLSDLLLGDANDDPVSLTSSSNDTSASASNVWLGIAITVGAVLLLYAAYTVGSGRGRAALTTAGSADNRRTTETNLRL